MVVVHLVSDTYIEWKPLFSQPVLKYQAWSEHLSIWSKWLLQIDVHEADMSVVTSLTLPPTTNHLTLACRSSSYLVIYLRALLVDVSVFQTISFNIGLVVTVSVDWMFQGTTSRTMPNCRSRSQGSNNRDHGRWLTGVLKEMLPVSMASRLILELTEIQHGRKLEVFSEARLLKVTTDRWDKSKEWFMKEV